MDANVELQLNEDEARNSLQSINARETSMEVDNEQEVPTIQWSDLPAHALEKIYSYLSRGDQYSMSQVCLNWASECNSPNLWRNMTFYLPKFGRQAKDGHPEVRSARQFAAYFRHVRIICRRFHSADLLIMKDYLESFFHHLACNSQLTSISFINMNEYIMYLSNENFEDLRQCLIRVLLNQSKLQSVIFQKCLFKKPAAIDIINSIVLKCSKTLEKLVLEEFVDERNRVPHNESVDATINVPLTFETFMNLKMLTIDYSHYFERIITKFFEYGSGLQLQKEGNLETLLLLCDGTEFRYGTEFRTYNTIQPEAWEYFKKIFPAVRLEVKIKIKDAPRHEFRTFIVTHMPVKSLDISLRTNIEGLLRHLTECQINQCLESLVISAFTSNFDTFNLAEDLVAFLQVAPNLKNLHLSTEVPVPFLSTVYEYWLVNGRKSLESFHICLKKAPTRQRAKNFINQADYYSRLLRRMGLNVSYRLESNLDDHRNP